MVDHQLITNFCTLIHIKLSSINIKEENMGQLNECCIRKMEILQFEHFDLLDPSLVDQIENLRKESQAESKGETMEYSYPNHVIFKGVVDKDGLKQSYGELHQNGCAYYGYFRDDLPQGKGILIRSGNEYYIGQFHDGKQHGMGKEYSEDSSFDGEYLNGFRKKGTFHDLTLEYIGSFLNNQFHGQGRVTFKKGDSYEGGFSYGSYSGKGILTLASGAIYEGSFVKGKYEGEGKYTWNNQDTYTGSYEGGVRTNRGIVLCKDKRFTVTLGQSKQGFYKKADANSPTQIQNKQNSIGLLQHPCELKKSSFIYLI